MLKTKEKEDIARCDIARPPVDLSCVPLHDLVPGLEFLPCIDILTSFEVRTVQVEYGRQPLCPIAIHDLLQ
jgi:hypothetical protein